MTNHDTRKFDAMTDYLKGNLHTLTTQLDSDVHCTPALLAGLATAKLWVAELRDEPGGWDTFRARLHRIIEQVTGAQDAGAPTAFGLWDGLHGAYSTAIRIEAGEA